MLFNRAFKDSKLTLMSLSLYPLCIHITIGVLGTLYSNAHDYKCKDDSNKYMALGISSY